jgi:UDP-N-acetylglucosamine 2-epimerase (non-hydrolysing)
MTIRTLIVIGTRPEAIKMAPVVKLLEKDARFANQICTSGQHQEMLQAMLEVFALKANFSFKTMTPNQNLSTLTARLLDYFSQLFSQEQPDIILVQGDTTTAFVAALAAFYCKIPVGHVEAGLRTKNIYSPWPEEAHRTLIGPLARIHFAPTPHARINLLNEGIASHAIHVTGNTVIDALNMTIRDLHTKKIREDLRKLTQQRQYILVTGHRRENFGYKFKQICLALSTIAKNNPEIDIVYPVHLNPNVQKSVLSILGNTNNIKLIKPLDYVSFVYLMQSAYLILTDSGGIQEEAPSLGKPVLVMRENTERPEAVAAGIVELVGTDPDLIVSRVNKLLHDKSHYQTMSEAINPYGDGSAAPRIINALAELCLSQKNQQGVPHA